MKVRLILNGKAAGRDSVREAVNLIRKQHSDISLEVRVTWEGGDAERLVDEAITDKVERLIVGGGDGSINEAVCALMRHQQPDRPELAILPLGTANDFATSCEIPPDEFSALELAVNGASKSVDVIKAGDNFCLNAATGGFGAEVTASTPPELKRILGGGAYSLMGLVMGLNFQASQGTIVMPDKEKSGAVIVASICNGRQAGGGKVLAPSAKINDGLLDLLLVKPFNLSELGTVAEEINRLDEQGTLVAYHQVPWLELTPEKPININFDGEPKEVDFVRFEVLPAEIELVLPSECPLLI